LFPIKTLPLDPDPCIFALKNTTFFNVLGQCGTIFFNKNIVVSTKDGSNFMSDFRGIPLLLLVLDNTAVLTAKINSHWILSPSPIMKFSLDTCKLEEEGKEQSLISRNLRFPNTVMRAGNAGGVTW
jgi:hypothetical protein